MDVIYHFDDRKFVVTGASSGMGRQIALELAEAGAMILAIARRQDKLEELRSLYPKNIICGVADVRDTGAIEALVKGFVIKYGKLHGCVHAAGISAATPLRAFDEQKARAIMDISFWSALYLMQIVNKKKYAEAGCSNVLFASVSANIGEKSLSVYSAAKAALQVAVRSMAKEIYKNENRINTISPGWVTTEMTAKEIAETNVSQEIFDRHLLGLGKPEDVSGMVLFLLSKRARWITGADFVVDGGYLLGGYN